MSAGTPIRGFFERVNEVTYALSEPLSSIAKRAKIAKSTAYGTACTSWSLMTLLKFCETTGVSADYLLGISEEMFRKKDISNNPDEEIKEALNTLVKHNVISKAQGEQFYHWHLEFSAKRKYWED